MSEKETGELLSPNEFREEVAKPTLATPDYSTVGIGRGTVMETKYDPELNAVVTLPYSGKPLAPCDPLPLHTETAFGLGGFHHPGMKAFAPVLARELDQAAQREWEGLLNIFAHFHPGNGDMVVIPAVFVYEGYVGQLHSVFVRYQLLEDLSFTYVTRYSDYVMVTDLGADEDFQTVETLMFRNQLLWKFTDMLGTVSSTIELPMNWISCPLDNAMDTLVNGDFAHLDHVVALFKAEFMKKVAVITAIAKELVKQVPKKDHDLYLAFKGVDNFTQANVCLERVYPELPEGGSISVGDDPLSVDDWHMYPKPVQTLVQRIVHGQKHLNKLMAKYRARLVDNPAIMEIWEFEVRQQLIAASHFIDRLYVFEPKYGQDLVLGMANDVLKRLEAHGGNIGLDINEWVVYSYANKDAPPVPVMTEGLNFKKSLFNRYTESFVNAVMGYLLGCGHPLVRPYTWRHKVDPTDGIPVGTYRRAD